MQQIYLSVVIPSYDEMANLQKGVLIKVIDFLEKKHKSYEIIIVDDGSTDGSVSYVENIAKTHKQLHIIKNSHMGKAGAVTSGMLAAKGEYVLFTDMDQAAPIEELDSLLPMLVEKKCDIAIGSRTSEDNNYPWSRLVMHEGMILLRKIIVGLPEINDTQCGFKLFTYTSARKIFEKISSLHHGFKIITGSAVTAGFDVELLFLAKKLGFAIQEVPVQWLYVETRRVNPIKDSLEGLRGLFYIRINQFLGKYS